MQVVHNGIDVDVFKPTKAPAVLTKYGIAADRPYVLFVGRITRQKGLPHLLRAVRHMKRGRATGAVRFGGRHPRARRRGSRRGSARCARTNGSDSVVWIEQAVPRPDLVPLYSQAATFVCPSIYEPLGIVNLEAMACGTAVVASDVGGIPEVVNDKETGLLVHYGDTRPDAFELDLASALDEMVRDPERAARDGRGRPRTRGRALRLGGDRSQDGRGVPLGRSGEIAAEACAALPMAPGHDGSDRGGRSGLGRAIATALGAEHGPVGLIARRQEPLDALASKLAESGVAAQAFVRRTSRMRSLRAAIAAARAAHGPPTVVVFNASLWVPGPPSRMSLEPVPHGSGHRTDRGGGDCDGGGGRPVGRGAELDAPVHRVRGRL